ncbi:MAG: M15 family metallopeptidase [Prevotella sp.]|nr:M15 family metallopeptidase [Prevotella sp.]
MRRFFLSLTVLFSVETAVWSQQQKAPDGGQSLSRTALSMARQGLVNVKDVDPTLRVSLMYARKDNFTGAVLYGDLREAYLLPKAAEALKKAQARLKELRPGLSLIVYDAARPMSIQQRMWDKVKNTPQYFYVSNPKNGGGMHNYGMAVDISICNERGDTIPMGTKVDHMSALSHIDKEAELAAQGRLSAEAMENRKLLREAMEAGGWKPLRTEWWHFNLCTRAEARAKYRVVR